MAGTGPAWLRKGGKAELRSDEEGYNGAWFAVEIVLLFPAKNQAAVQYIDFVVSDEPGSGRITEFVKVDNLRPLPPKQPQRKSWKVRDSVETLHNDAWWVGYIKDFGAKADTYRVYYGKDQAELVIAAVNIRPRQNYVRPSWDCPNGSWSLARPMQNPAVWERREETPGKKTPVAKTQPRVCVPAPHVGDESDDSWDEQEERRQKPKKKPRVQSQSKSKSAPAKSEVEPKKIIRFVKYPKTVTITHAIPAINPPSKPAEQTTLLLTPGSSPPLTDSPFQDSAISPGSDSQARKPLADAEASSPTRSSSSNSSGRDSDSSNSSSSGGDDDDCVQSGDGDHSAEGDVSIHGRMSNGIFPDFSNDERTRHNKNVYHQLLECFRRDSKGVLDTQRHNILTDIREELKLTKSDVNQAHCAVFGMPLP